MQISSILEAKTGLFQAGTSCNKEFYPCNLAPVDHILIFQGTHTGLEILFNPSEVFDEGLKNRELFYSR